MTVLLDAFAVIAVLAGEPAAQEIASELRKPSADVRISSVNLAEVVDQLIRVAGNAPDLVESSLQLLADGGLQIAAVDERIGRLAGEYRAKHYDKRTAALSLADCIALATSSVIGATVATSDPALAAAARVEGLAVLGLPDARGRRP